MNNPAVKTKVVEEEGPANDIAALLESIIRLNERLDRLESKALPPNIVQFPDNIHPSRETFNIPEIEAVDPNGRPVDKICSFEPHGRPCDHCSMCSARGF